MYLFWWTKGYQIVKYVNTKHCAICAVFKVFELILLLIINILMKLVKLQKKYSNSKDRLKDFL